MSEDQCSAKEVCEHHWATHCYHGLSVRLCTLCHEPDWDELALTDAIVKLGIEGCYLDITSSRYPEWKHELQAAVRAHLRIDQPYATLRP